MKHLRLFTLIFGVLTVYASTRAQDFEEINHLWQQAVDATRRGEIDHAQAVFGEFNQRVRTYVAANGLSWRIEYLVGSLDCQFLDTKGSGAKLLKEVLQNNRDLNHAGELELERQLAACTAPASTPMSDTRPDLPQDIVVAAAHFQAPGVHGDMKGGYTDKFDNESSAAVSPIQVSELLARRVELNNPQEALHAALSRLPVGGTGAIVQGFAVITTDSDKSRAVAIGECLGDYMPPLKKQFEIEPSNYMVTVYTARRTDEVYAYARILHGIQLPRGVVAYSVPEDMSLAAVADPLACGSAAHELVHLLIKRNFPVSPAWLEEGLASEVAVASPTQDRFKFSNSWRDDALKKHLGLRPSVAGLLELSWSKFNTNNPFEMSEIAATQAMAAVFIRYLDSKDKLSDIYFAVRDHHLSPDMSECKTYREIVEEKLGMNVSEIDRDFGQWFEQQKSAGPGTSVPCQIITGPEQRGASPCAPDTKNHENTSPKSPKMD